MARKVLSPAGMLLGDGTKSKILEELTDGPKTARELADLLHIQESAVRMHLERLARRGIVVPHFHKEGVGRPRKRFALTDEGFELFPRRYELLVESLIDSILEQGGENYLSGIFSKAADRFADRLMLEFPAIQGAEPGEARVRQVVRVLDRLGQRATVVHDEHGPRIVRRNCIFRGSALAHSNLICEVFDQRLLQRLMGNPSVELLSSLPRGAPTCSHLIQLSSVAAD
jgi:predicted ArsR family transcriptional regulator